MTKRSSKKIKLTLKPSTLIDLIKGTELYAEEDGIEVRLCPTYDIYEVGEELSGYILELEDAVKEFKRLRSAITNNDQR